MLLGLGEPLVDVVPGWLGPGPILIFLLAGWIDHAGDMPGPGNHEPHRPAKKFAAEIDRFGRSDVIFTGREVIDGHFYLAQIERRAGDLQLAAREIVFQVAITKIERMIG